LDVCFESRKEPNLAPRTSLTSAARWLDEAIRDGRLRREQLRRRRPKGKATAERHHVAELAQNA
jgi:hypothetical protein